MRSANKARAGAIAIDGPAASGKTIVGLRVAARLGYKFVDTGAMYRAVTWYALRRGIDPSDEAALVDLASTSQIVVRQASNSEEEPTEVMIDGEEATPHLRTEDVEANVSLVSRVPGVRAALVRIQRETAHHSEIVMAGRDIGTVVLPDADLKVYLDASREVRARRRADQLRVAGVAIDLNEIIEDLARRDGIDSTRSASPLTPAVDAVIIRTDDITVEEVIERILKAAG